jgi:diadenosine tetraphosphate (Ap4A) HIT family hydrolase
MKCLFCDWRRLKNEMFYETQNFVCLYNLRPVFAGHSLIIPKRHMTTLLKMNENEIEEFPSVVKLAFVALKKAYRADGFNLVLQEGSAAGASVKHVHFHVLPRHKGDMPARTEWMEYFKKHEFKRRKLTRPQMAKEVAKIKRAIEGL